MNKSCKFKLPDQSRPLPPDRVIPRPEPGHVLYANNWQPGPRDHSIQEHRVLGGEQVPNRIEPELQPWNLTLGPRKRYRVMR